MHFIFTIVSKLLQKKLHFEYITHNVHIIYIFVFRYLLRYLHAVTYMAKCGGV